MPELVGGLIVAALYLAVAWAWVAAGRRGEEPPSWARRLLLVGAVAHAALMVGRAVLGSALPSFADSLSALGWGVMVAVVWGARRDLGVLGMFLVPVGAAMHGVSLLVPAAQVSALPLAGASWWLPVHVGLVLAASTSFFVELVVGALREVVRRRLKAKRLAGLTAFPSLETLDRMQLRALIFGLACLAAGMAAGGGWAASVLHGQQWISDPKVIFSGIVWLWYATSLFIRVRSGWHGRGSLVLSITGFVLLIFSMVGLDFVSAGFHAYGW